MSAFYFAFMCFFTTFTISNNERYKVKINKQKIKKMKHLASYSDKEIIQNLINDKDGEITELILNSSEGGLRTLNKIDEVYLSNLNISKGKREKLLFSLELGRRVHTAESRERFQIKSSHDVFLYVHAELSALNHEAFNVIYLNRNNTIIKYSNIFRGGIAGVVVDVRLILKEALFLNCTSIVLVHNHPSGNKLPSDADISITKKVKDAAKFMDIAVLDHIIIADQEYYSFADEGAL